MNSRVLAAALALSCLPLAAQATDTGRGESLHEEHCTRCHDTRVYTRPDRRITSLDSLKTQVQRCETNLGLQWFDDEVDAVTAYLNANYYKFPAGGAQ
jgi:hypothetical protein